MRCGTITCCLSAAPSPTGSRASAAHRQEPSAVAAAHRNGVLVGSLANRDSDLVVFLRHFSRRTKIASCSPAEFVRELAARYTSRTASLGCRSLAESPSRDDSSDVRERRAGMTPGAVFISYTHEDQAAARRLRDFLEEEAGIDVWLDTGRLEAGDDWDLKIRRNIKSCSYFMPLISAAATRAAVKAISAANGDWRRIGRWTSRNRSRLSSRWRSTIRMKRRWRSRAVSRGAMDPIAGGAGNEEFRRRMVALVRDYRRRTHNDLAADLRRSLDAENPWPGLMPFTEATQAFFHGRDAEAAELLRRVRRERLTILFGQSGLGKTSLLCAGLFPRLRAADFFPVYIRLDWTTAYLPGRADQAGARREPGGTRCRGPAAAPGRDPVGYFHDKETEFWSRRNRLVTPVLVFDQFEEIFTLGHGTHGEAVLDELAAWSKIGRRRACARPSMTIPTPPAATISARRVAR